MVYPLLSKLCPSPTTICSQFRTTLLAAGHVAAGDASSAVAAFDHIDRSYHPKAYELAIVQAVPFIGIPRVLHSAAALQTAGVSINSTQNTFDKLDQSTIEDLLKTGTLTFRSVYQRNEERVRKRLKEFHPVLDQWIIASVYGWLLSRTDDTAQLVTLRERELSAVAALSVDPCASVQLASHVRGAINVGATPDEVLSVIQQTHVVAPQAASSAEAVWHTFHRARHAL